MWNCFPPTSCLWKSGCIKCLNAWTLILHFGICTLTEPVTISISHNSQVLLFLVVITKSFKLLYGQFLGVSRVVLMTRIHGGRIDPLVFTTKAHFFSVLNSLFTAATVLPWLKAVLCPPYCTVSNKEGKHNVTSTPHTLPASHPTSHITQEGPPVPVGEASEEYTIPYSIVQGYSHERGGYGPGRTWI